MKMGYNKATRKSAKFWKDPVGVMNTAGKSSIPKAKKKIKILP